MTVVALMLAYVLLLAIPFMPGVEIGISLLVAHGAVAAPFVYLGTLAGLMLAFGFGVLLSGPVSCRFLMVLGLTRACAFVDETKRLSPPNDCNGCKTSCPDASDTGCFGIVLCCSRRC